MPSGLFNTKLLSALIVFLTLGTVGLTLRKRKAQLTMKMIKFGFLNQPFFLPEALICCTKVVIRQTDINVHQIKGAISGPHFYMNIHTLESQKICFLTS